VAIFLYSVTIALALGAAQYLGEADHRSIGNADYHESATVTHDTAAGGWQDQVDHGR
jgi:hypothetical protein